MGASGGVVRALTARSSDADVVAAYRAGESEAFAMIHNRHGAALLRFARRMLPDGNLADDVVQEALLRASLALRRDAKPIDLKPWLFRIVRNCALDELARGRFTVSFDDETATHLAAPTEVGPVATYERRGRLRDVLDDIAELPPAQRHALLARELEGASHAELAAELGISVQASKNLVHRARIQLVQAREARTADCGEIRLDLLAAADEGRRARAASLRHLANCPPCRAYRVDLRRTGRALRILEPGTLLLSLGLGGGAAVTAGKTTALVGASAVVLGATGLATQIAGPGDASPQTVRSRAVPSGLVAAGRVLPAGTTVIRQGIALAPGRSPTGAVEVTCPPALRIADLLPPSSTAVSVSYGPGTIVGVSGRARIVVRAPASPQPTTLSVGVLCKRPDLVGSLLTPGARAFVHASHHVSVPRAELLDQPGGRPLATVRRGQPVVRQASRGRWLRVLADTGESGWVRASGLTPTR